MAPEVLNNNKYGKSVDWWTFAILIYEMTFGTPPFINNLGTDDLRNKIINKNILIPSSFSP
jgi:serine/threonine protein kinase